ncbi:MAG TPA: translation initiation factor IF-2 associated domain-containing protein, partial [Dongiaceae bacterium]|nr:translation initiation factor IF-2 associated domain-containing protein [Dongiaceae bacterium]
MAVTTVAQLATELNRPAATLLEQLQSAGVAKKTPEDALTESDKERLLEFLHSAHGTTAGGDRKKITLTRKSTSEIKQADASGKARTIQVEVRKKRVFVKRDDAPGVAHEEDAAPAAPVVDDAELARREEEASRQAELIRRQEEELAEKRRQREERERAEREAAERAAAAAEAAAAEAAAAEAAAKAQAALAKAAGAPPAEPAPAPAPAAAAPAPAPVEAPPPPKPGLRVIKAADADAEEKQRLADLGKRRQAAEAEAAAIRDMMSRKNKVMVAKKPEEPKPAEAVAKEGIKGTIHKAKGAPGAAAPGTTAVAKPGDKKSVKSEKLSSSWADDAKKRGATANKGRTDSGAGRPGWRAPRGGRRGDSRDGAGGSNYQAPTEPV